MAESSSALASVKAQDTTLPTGFTQQDADYVKTLLPVPERVTGTATSACKIVITRSVGGPIASAVCRSGPDDYKIHPDFWSKDETSAKANKDAECKAASYILDQVTGAWTTGLVPNAVTIYVLGSPGPCSVCRGKLKMWAKNCNNARLVCVYRSVSNTEINSTVGGLSGFEDAEKWNGLWVCVPAAVAVEKEKERGKLELYTETRFQLWLGKKDPNSSLLRDLKKNQIDLLIEMNKNEGYIKELKEALGVKGS